MNIDVPENIKDNDLLGRAIFSSTEAKRASSGKIRSYVFIEKPGKPLSVDRFGFCSQEELTTIQDKNAQQGREGRSFYGWASLKAVDVRKKNRQLRSTPISNPYHADIILPEDTNTKDDQIAHAIDLVESSNWKPKYSPH